MFLMKRIEHAAGLKRCFRKPGVQPSYRPQIVYSYVVDAIPRVGLHLGQQRLVPRRGK